MIMPLKEIFSSEKNSFDLKVFTSPRFFPSKMSAAFEGLNCIEWQIDGFTVTVDFKYELIVSL